MNDISQTPRWLLTTVVGPLALIAIIGGVGTYYAVESLRDSVDRLESIVRRLPRKEDLDAKYEFVTYRIGRLEKRVSTNRGLIDDTRDRLPNDAVWRPPQPFPPYGGGYVMRLALTTKPKMSRSLRISAWGLM